MNDDQYLLASAYVDGELTDDERRSAESDADVMSEVEFLRVIQSEVRTVEPASHAAREAAIGAAMAVFSSGLEQRPAPTGQPVAGITTAPSFTRRRWSTRYLGVAAGLLAVGLLGTVIVSSLGAGGDDDAASEAVANTALLTAQEPASSRLVEATDGDTDQFAADDGGAPAAAEVAPTADQPAAATAAPAEEPAAESDMSDMTVGDAARPEIDPTQPLTTPAELGSYGSYLVELQQAGQLPPTPNTRCAQPGILSATQYVIDGVPVDVLVAVDDIARSTTAIDPDTCASLVVGPLY